VGKVVMFCWLYFAVHHKLIYYDVTQRIYFLRITSAQHRSAPCIFRSEVTARRIQDLFIIPTFKTVGKYLFPSPCS